MVIADSGKEELQRSTVRGTGEQPAPEKGELGRALGRGCKAEVMEKGNFSTFKKCM